MRDEEISALLSQQNNKITDSQLQSIRDYDILAYWLKYNAETCRYEMWSKWGGSWEFEYMKD